MWNEKNLTIGILVVSKVLYAGHFSQTGTNWSNQFLMELALYTGDSHAGTDL